MKEMIRFGLTLIYFSVKFMIMGIVSILVGWYFFKLAMPMDLLGAGFLAIVLIILTYKLLDLCFDKLEYLFNY